MVTLGCPATKSVGTGGAYIRADSTLIDPVHVAHSGRNRSIALNVSRLAVEIKRAIPDSTQRVADGAASGAGGKRAGDAHGIRGRAAAGEVGADASGDGTASGISEGAAMGADASVTLAHRNSRPAEAIADPPPPRSPK